MDYIVLDLEWNQSPEGKENSVESMPFEIIEVGAATDSISRLYDLINSLAIVINLIVSVIYTFEAPRTRLFYRTDF